MRERLVCFRYFPRERFIADILMQTYNQAKRC
jgi:hypothetical protein